MTNATEIAKMPMYLQSIPNQLRDPQWMRDNAIYTRNAAANRIEELEREVADLRDEVNQRRAHIEDGIMVSSDKVNEAHNAAIEEAAKTAEAAINDQGKDIAAQIRALKRKTPIVDTTGARSGGC